MSEKEVVETSAEQVERVGNKQMNSEPLHRVYCSLVRDRGWLRCGGLFAGDVFLLF